MGVLDSRLRGNGHESLYFALGHENPHPYPLPQGEGEGEGIHLGLKAIP
jgi:hypothetical protein